MASSTSRPRSVDPGATSARYGHAPFVVVLPYPPSLNHLWRRVGNRTLLSAEGRDYHKSVALIVGHARANGQPVPWSPHRVMLLATPPDRRRRDLDNLLKATLDPLYRAIGQDDSVIDDLRIVWRRDGRGARIEVIVEPAAPEHGRDE